jgi:hypothetical protein
VLLLWGPASVIPTKKMRSIHTNCPIGSDFFALARGCTIVSVKQLPGGFLGYFTHLSPMMSGSAKAFDAVRKNF